MIEIVKELVQTMESAIHAGDWKVDGACDPDLILRIAKKAIQNDKCREALERLAEENKRLGLEY